MKAVGIKQLKARLSEYVRLARGGEIILVSDRDEVVATLGPPGHQDTEPGSRQALLARLAERGVLTRAGAQKKGWRWSPSHLGMAPETAAALVGQLRDDR